MTTKSEFRNSFGEAVKDLSWVAGFFDGEGCIYYKPDTIKATHKGKEYHAPQLQVIVAQSGDKGKALCEAFQQEYGFGKITSYHGSKLTKKTPYMTRLHGKNAISFLETIVDKLHIKRDKAELVIKEGNTHFYGKE